MAYQSTDIYEIKHLLNKALVSAAKLSGAQKLSDEREREHTQNLQFLRKLMDKIQIPIFPRISSNLNNFFALNVDF